MIKRLEVKLRTAVRLISAMLFILLLVACQAPADEAVEPSTDSETQVEETEAEAPEQTSEETSSGGELVVTGWAGTWGDCMTETVIEPFEEQFNATLTLALPGASTDILARLRAEARNPTMDVVLIGGALEEVAAEEGLMEEVDWATVAPNWNDIIPEAQIVPGYGPSIAMSGIGIGYNTEEMPFTPTSWLDFWDPQLEGQGVVAVNNMDGNFGLAMMAIINELTGGTEENQDPAFEKFTELMRSHTPLITTSTQEVADALAQRGALMAVGPNSRFIEMAKEGLPVDIVYPEEGGFIWGNFAGIPKGSPNKELAIEFINFYLDPEIQKEWSTCVNYSPVNTKVDLSDYAYGDALIVENVYPLDWEWINENRADWIERWNTEVLPALNE